MRLSLVFKRLPQKRNHKTPKALHHNGGLTKMKTARKKQVQVPPAQFEQVTPSENLSNLVNLELSVQINT